MVFFIIILGLLADRVTKLWALKCLKDSSDVVVIKNLFGFSYLENRGAAFGILQNKVLFLSILTLAMTLAMIFYIYKYKPKSKLIKASLALIIAGAIGNLWDRIMYKYVVDFILLHYKDVYNFPTFNVADMLVVCGTILLAFCIIKEDYNEK